MLFPHKDDDDPNRNPEQRIKSSIFGRFVFDVHCTTTPDRIHVELVHGTHEHQVDISSVTPN